MEVILSRFILSILLLTPTTSEPVCSKFAYEEQLLEKMVKVEFNVGQMEKEIKNTNILVLESLQQLKQNWEKVTDESKAMEMKARKVLNENEEKITKEIDDLRAGKAKAAEEYDEKIMRLETVSVPNIAFKTRFPSSLDPKEDKVFVFTQNIVNIGNAYDNATGVFTAPIDGTYLFTTQVCLMRETRISFGIYIDDKLYTVGRFSEKNIHTCFIVKTTGVMLANQRASVKSWSASSGSKLYEDTKH